jgi:hypothetical protein
MALLLKQRKAVPGFEVLILLMSTVRGIFAMWNWQI